MTPHELVFWGWIALGASGALCVFILIVLVIDRLRRGSEE